MNVIKILIAISVMPFNFVLFLPIVLIFIYKKFMEGLKSIFKLSARPIDATSMCPVLSWLVLLCQHGNYLWSSVPKWELIMNPGLTALGTSALASWLKMCSYHNIWTTNMFLLHNAQPQSRPILAAFHIWSHWTVFLLSTVITALIAIFTALWLAARHVFSLDKSNI